MFNTHTKSRQSRVKINEQVVTLASLERKARNTNRAFWGLTISSALVGSMVVPYMSFAAVADSASNAFTSTVIPGYSMGGVELKAYGLDLNDWGTVNNAKVVGSTYGVWSGSRKSSQKFSAKDDGKTGENKSIDTKQLMNTVDKAIGWQAITGRMSYTASDPDGINGSTANRIDEVAPYRTTTDYYYWDTQSPKSATSGSADITVSLVPDFIIVSKDANGNVIGLQSPDNIGSAEYGTKLTNSISGNSTGSWDCTTKNAAVPFYISLRDCFDAYGISEAANATMNNLMEKISADNGGALKSIVNDSHNLLSGTKYSAVNADGSAINNESEAFNPYPYSMVFSKTESSGKVTSSIYNNAEAYVYFAPSSVYTAYINLKKEYETLQSQAATEEGKINDPVTVFQLGYYLSAMSIMEAYLNEALPQDMTRGYVGTSESSQLGVDYSGTISAASGEYNDENALKQHLYSSLMWSVAKTIDADSTYQSSWHQNRNNAIMDTLSCFGYAPLNKLGDGGELGLATNVSQWGPMAGMSAKTNLTRLTMFSPYADQQGSASDKDESKNNLENGEFASAGMYTPTYYPIQQHKLPDSEKLYRFQILSSVPYGTLLQNIKDYGFASNVQFIYSTSSNDGNNTGTSSEDSSNSDSSSSSSSRKSDIESFASTVSGARDKVAQLAYQYQQAEEKSGQDDSLVSLSTVTYGGSNFQRLAVFGGGTQTAGNGESAEMKTAQRIDAALLGYQANEMTSDNVHDLVDIVRATRGLKYETWLRYYNPLKSEGGDEDLFLARVTPAKTTYMPSILIKGYTCAGGKTVSEGLNPSNVSFDYFSYPSFGPCFASHTAEDTYYGAINYELRNFYSAGFIKTLSNSANVPAVEAYENLSQKLEELQDEQAKEAQTINANLATLFIAAKRYALLETIEQTQVKGYTFTQSEYKSLGLDVATAWTWFPSGTEKGTRKQYSQANSAGNVETTSNGETTIRGSQTAAQNGNPNFVGVDVTVNKGTSTQDQETQKERGQDYIDVSENSYEKGIFGNDPLISSQDNDRYGNPRGGNAGEVNFKGADSDPDIWTFSFNKMFSAKYYANLSQLIFDEKATYFWDKKDALLPTIQKVDAKQILTEKSGQIENAEIQQVFTVYLPQSGWDTVFNALGIDSKKLTDAGGNINDPEATRMWREALGKCMDACSEQIGIAFTNLRKDFDSLTNAMPSNMQNCLAWADYRNSTDSVNQHENTSNDQEASLTINIDAGQTEKKEIDPSNIKSVNDLSKYGFGMEKRDDGDYYPVDNQLATSDDEMQKRMQPGVEGSAATASIEPAVYTISATTKRIDDLSSVGGTTYPYSGLAQGRFYSGTDRYASLQSHVIDYSSIASGIAGDLASRTRSHQVVLSEPQYTSNEDVKNALDKIASMFREFGTSFMRMAEEAFKSALFGDGTQVSVQTSSNTGAIGSTMSTISAPATFTSGQSSVSTTATASSSGPVGASSIVNESAKLIITFAPFMAIYGVIQSVALALVLVFIGYIAFANFWAYTTKNSSSMIKAQTELKVVFPRTVIAMLMIGFPPIAGGVGFEGGNFILLELISNIVGYVAEIFYSLNGTSIMSVITNIDLFSSYGINIAAYLLYFLACIILALMFFAGAIIVLIQSLILFFFYLIGPIAWAFYVWPTETGTVTDEDRGGFISDLRRSTSQKNAAASASGLRNMIEQRMNLGFFTGKRCGNAAAAGLVANFTVISFLTVAYVVIFWIASMIFVNVAGVETASTAGIIYSSAAAKASADMGGFFLAMATPSPTIRILCALIIAGICFFLMFLITQSILKAQLGMTKGMIGTIADGIGKVKDHLSQDVATVADMSGIPQAAATATKMVGSAIPMAGKAAQLADKLEKSGLAGKIPGGLAATKVLNKAGKIADTASDKIGKLAASEKGQKILGKENANALKAATDAMAAAETPAEKAAANKKLTDITKSLGSQVSGAADAIKAIGENGHKMTGEERRNNLKAIAGGLPVMGGMISDAAAKTGAQQQKELASVKADIASLNGIEEVIKGNSAASSLDSAGQAQLAKMLGELKNADGTQKYSADQIKDMMSADKPGIKVSRADMAALMGTTSTRRKTLEDTQQYLETQMKTTAEEAEKFGGRVSELATIGAERAHKSLMSSTGDDIVSQTLNAQAYKELTAQFNDTSNMKDVYPPGTMIDANGNPTQHATRHFDYSLARAKAIDKLHLSGMSVEEAERALSTIEEDTFGGEFDGQLLDVKSFKDVRDTLVTSASRNDAALERSQNILSSNSGELTDEQKILVGEHYKSAANMSLASARHAEALALEAAIDKMPNAAEMQADPAFQSGKSVYDLWTPTDMDFEIWVANGWAKDKADAKAIFRQRSPRFDNINNIITEKIRANESGDGFLLDEGRKLQKAKEAEEAKAIKAAGAQAKYGTAEKVEKDFSSTAPTPAGKARKDAANAQREQSRRQAEQQAKADAIQRAMDEIKAKEDLTDAINRASSKL